MTAPLPALDPNNTPFWTGGKDGRLLICRCRACGRWLHPPVPVCRHCRSRDVGPDASVGTGSVLTFTVNHQPWLPGLHVPYAIAVVALDDDPELRLTSRIVGADPAEVHIEMRVAVRFEHVKDVWLPLFTPAGPL